MKYEPYHYSNLIILEGRTRTVDPTPTRLGIIQKEYLGYRDMMDLVRQDVGLITDHESNNIMEIKYWRENKCDLLPSPFDYVWCQCNLNLGPGISARIIQTILGVTVDGNFGSKSIAAVQASIHPLTICKDFLLAQIEHYKAHNKDSVGLVNRCKTVADQVGVELY